MTNTMMPYMHTVNVSDEDGEPIINPQLPSLPVTQLHRPFHLSQLSIDISIITCKNVHVPNPAFVDSCVKLAQGYIFPSLLPVHSLCLSTYCIILSVLGSIF